VTDSRVPGSCRDPSGFLYRRDGVLLRQVNPEYAEDYDQLKSSGLYDELVAQQLLIPHEEVDPELAHSQTAYKVLKPEPLAFISYPYEWCFSQLKDAALLTLDIQQRAYAKGMVLKDSTAYNVQFHNGKAIFIDTLSFERYEKGTPWSAYRQFCQHFLAPLALMSKVDIHLNQLFRTNIDGVPLELAAQLMPFKSRFSPSLAMHLFMHARGIAEAGRQKGAQGGSQKQRSFSQAAFLGLIDSLRSAITKLDWKPGGTEWFDYYEANNQYGEAGLEEKDKLVEDFVSQVPAGTVWDLGGNTGRFSRIAVGQGSNVICADIDPGCVEANYRYVKEHKETTLLPLQLDLTNPSPAIGWANAERDAFTERGPADMILALGLVHHLVIANNVAISMLAEFFSRSCQYLVVEFIPKGDPQMDKLLSSRPDIFPDYEKESFEASFSKYFRIARQEHVPHTPRTLYLMEVLN
jgi:ribosomal protein L11 methylase PrmA